MATSRTKDFETIQARLERFLAARLQSDRVVISDLDAPTLGASNKTMIFTATSVREGIEHADRFVLRVDSPNRLFPFGDIVFQCEVMRGLAGNPSVPVPQVRWLETDPAVIGAPFFVMDAIEGRVILQIPSPHTTGWLTELSPGARTELTHGALSALAAVHAVPWRRDLGFLAPRDPDKSALDNYLDTVRDWYDWAIKGRPCGVIADGLAYVLEHRPRTNDAVLLWGDAMWHNMIFAEDLSVAGVLDWEMATVGPAEVDLGWWLLFDEFCSGAVGASHLEGTLGRDEIVARYEQLVGRSMSDVRYYEILAALRFGVIIYRYMDNQIAAGDLDPETTLQTNNPVTQMLARWLELPEPDVAPEYGTLTRASLETD